MATLAAMVPAANWLVAVGALSYQLAHFVSAVGCAGALALWGLTPQRGTPKNLSICVALAFLASYAPGMLQGWNCYRISNDSLGYLVPYRFARPWEHMRLPGYPLFLEAVAMGRSIPCRESLLSMRGKVRTPMSAVEAPLLHMVRVQRVFLLGAIVVFAWSMSRCFPSPLLLVLCIPPVVVRLIPPEAGAILSEALTLGWILLAAACVISYARRPRLSRWLLAGFSAGVSFWIRPALLPLVGLVLVIPMFVRAVVIIT